MLKYKDQKVQKFILELIKDDYTYEEIGKILGVSRQRIEQIYARI